MAKIVMIMIEDFRAFVNTKKMKSPISANVLFAIDKERTKRQVEALMGLGRFDEAEALLLEQAADAAK